MFYLIETSKEGRIRKLRKGAKYAMERDMATMADSRTMAIHKFKNDTEAMEFIKAHNGPPQPATRFTSVAPAAAPAAVQTVLVSPIELTAGDRVMYHGATVEVIRVNESECKVTGGIRVAACISRRVGDDCGSIPPSWFETAQSMRDRGCPWAKDLPDGRYINVQGNAHARVAKIVG